MHQEVTLIPIPKETRSYCGPQGELALYDSVNDSAWAAADNPADLHDWR